MKKDDYAPMITKTVEWYNNLLVHHPNRYTFSSTGSRPSTVDAKYDLITGDFPHRMCATQIRIIINTYLEINFAMVNLQP